MKQPAAVAFILTGIAAWHLAVGPRSAPAREPNQDDSAPVAKLYYDYADSDGRLSGGRLTLAVSLPDGALPRMRSDVTTLIDHGPPDNRVDIVFVSDGYTADELGLYAAQVDVVLAEFFSEIPFEAYAPLINVHRVDVVSNESGVDHDPDYPTWRDTALDMGFWCGDIERLLCVDIVKAYQFASNAPDADQVLAAGNTTRRAGTAYLLGPENNIATFSAPHEDAGQIVLHELGHSLGDFADEYDYNDGATYTGPEPVERNISILTASEMEAAGTKWAAWLGVDDPAFAWLHSTYEGAFYHDFGIYRPTQFSKMRYLIFPFNHPSVEAFIIEMWMTVHPIDDATPTSAPLGEQDTISLTLVQPASHDLDVRWYLNEAEVVGASTPTLDLSTLGLLPGTHFVTVMVVDDTELVRDEPARDRWMRECRTWHVAVGAGVLGELNCDGTLDLDDVPLFVEALLDPAGFTGCDLDRADVNQDGSINGLDVQAFVAALLSPSHTQPEVIDNSPADDLVHYQACVPDEIAVWFSEDVRGPGSAGLSAADFEIDGSSAGITGFTYDTDEHRAGFSIDALSDGAWHTVRVSGDVESALGYRLYGNTCGGCPGDNHHWIDIAVLRADYQQDRDVDVLDRTQFLAAWAAQEGMTGEGLSADYDCDADVDAADRAAFLAAWSTNVGTDLSPPLEH